MKVTKPDIETGLTIVCRECDKRGIGKPAVYVVMRNANDNDINYFFLRSLFNPELEYYATAIKSDDDSIVTLAKLKHFKEPFFKKI